MGTKAYVLQYRDLSTFPLGTKENKSISYQCECITQRLGKPGIKGLSKFYVNINDLPRSSQDYSTLYHNWKLFLSIIIPCGLYLKNILTWKYGNFSNQSILFARQ